MRVRAGCALPLGGLAGSRIYRLFRGDHFSAEELDAWIANTWLAIAGTGGSPHSAAGALCGGGAGNHSYSQLINYFATDIGKASQKHFQADDPGRWWAVWCDPELLARFALELDQYELTPERRAALADLTNLYDCWSAPVRIYIGGSYYSETDLNDRWLWCYWRFGKGWWVGWAALFMLEPSHDNFSDLVARKQAKHPKRQEWGVVSNSDLERRTNCPCGLIICTGDTCNQTN